MDRLRKDVMHSIPTEEKNGLLSQMLDHPFKTWQNTVEKNRKISPNALPSKEELPTKKSTGSLPVALDIALMKSNVYLTNKRNGNNPESQISKEIPSAKRFRIPKIQKILPTLSMSRAPKQTSFFEDKRTSSEVSPMFSVGTPMFSESSQTSSETTPKSSEVNTMTTKNSKAVFESRAKRQEDDVLEEQSPTADSITDGDMQTTSLHQYNTPEPTENVDNQVVNARSGVNVGRVVTVLPEIPVVMYDTRPNDLGSSDK